MGFRKSPTLSRRIINRQTMGMSSREDDSALDFTTTKKVLMDSPSNSLSDGSHQSGVSPKYHPSPGTSEDESDPSVPRTQEATSSSSAGESKPFCSSSAAASMFTSMDSHLNPLLGAALGSRAATAAGLNSAFASTPFPGLTSFASYGTQGFATDPTSPFSFTPTSALATALTLHRKRRGDSCQPAEKKIKPVPDEKKDDAYWERRRKNNEAAKRSRDSRRAKEDEIAMRAAFLEQENLKLRAQVALLRNETQKLQYMLFNHV